MITAPKKGFPLVFCRKHGWLPAFFRGWPTETCPLCQLLGDPELGWVAEELLEHGEVTEADLAVLAVTGEWPETLGEATPEEERRVREILSRLFDTDVGDS